MPVPEDRELARIRSESAAHIVSASASCAATAAHVRQSQAAIDQSLRLLAEIRPRPDGGELSVPGNGRARRME